MALAGDAPKIFGRTNRKGVPYAAVLATWAIGFLAYLNVSNTGAQVFTWFSNISTISGFIAWIVCMVTYIRFRKALTYQNLLQTLPYRTPFQPYFVYIILGVIIVLTLTNGFHVFFPGNWSASNFLAAYITLPIFLVMYLGHKLYFKTPFAIKVQDIDVITGKKEMDELCSHDVAPVPKNWAQRAWFWIA
jgi:yeast amino acid transporter